MAGLTPESIEKLDRIMVAAGIVRALPKVAMVRLFSVPGRLFTQN
jgi:hypothetical protein